jgi:hypothetical protein
MSLLDTASLILTPNAYKEGKLYSVIPSDGSGDMSVVRATSATRINSEGLIEVVSLLGNELVTNGDFATDSDWTKQTGWSISNGVANYDFTSDVKYIRQTLLNGGFVSGKTYRINFEITTGTAYMYINSNGGGLISLNTYSVGSYSLYTTASVNGSDLLIYGRNTGGTAFSIDNVSIKEVITNNIPRIDYSLGGCPNILLEPQRTNIATYSEDITQWAGSLSVTANNTISPDGTQNADKVTSSGSTQTRYKSFSGNANCTASIFAKKVDSDYILISYGQPATRYAIFRFSDGVCTTATSGITTTSTNYGNGWWRFSMSTTSLSAGYIELCPNANGTSRDSAGSCYVWGAQYENLASYATSYIPTTSASVTRNADVCVKTGISSLIGQTEGTMFVDFVCNSTANTGSYDYILTISNTATNKIEILKNNTTAELYILARVGGVNQVQSLPITGTNVLGHHKVALAYKLNDYALYLDGALVFTDTTATVPTCNDIYLGQYLTGTEQLGGGIKATALWKTRLTNTELAQLTTI